MSARVGIDLGGTKIEGVRLDARAGVVARERMETPRDDYFRCVECICELVHALGDDDTPVGIGTPGAWLADEGAMKNCNSTWLNGRPLLTDLTARLGARVRMANDADCFALSEALDGAAAGAASVFGVILGTGVGGGLVLNGTLLEGPNGLAGEWGHTPLPYFRTERGSGVLERDLGDRRCYCGRMNCVETFLSGPGFARTHFEITGDRREPSEITAAADAGDPRARRSLTLYLEMLARSLAQVINVLDPHVIVLGGGMSNIAAIYDEVPRRWARHVFHDGAATGASTVRTRLVPPAHGDSSGVLGAARLWAL